MKKTFQIIRTQYFFDDSFGYVLRAVKFRTLYDIIAASLILLNIASHAIHAKGMTAFFLAKMRIDVIADIAQYFPIPLPIGHLVFPLDLNWIDGDGGIPPQWKFRVILREKISHNIQRKFCGFEIQIFSFDGFYIPDLIHFLIDKISQLAF